MKPEKPGPQVGEPVSERVSVDAVRFHTRTVAPTRTVEQGQGCPLPLTHSPAHPLTDSDPALPLTHSPAHPLTDSGPAFERVVELFDDTPVVTAEEFNIYAAISPAEASALGWIDLRHTAEGVRWCWPAGAVLRRLEELWIVNPVDPQKRTRTMNPPEKITTEAPQIVTAASRQTGKTEALARYVDEHNGGSEVAEDRLKPAQRAPTRAEDIIALAKLVEEVHQVAQRTSLRLMEISQVQAALGWPDYAFVENAVFELEKEAMKMYGAMSRFYSEIQKQEPKGAQPS